MFVLIKNQCYNRIPCSIVSLFITSPISAVRSYVYKFFGRTKGTF